LRIVLIVVGAVLALLVAAVLVGPSLVDWNAHKDRIVAEVREATGREFSIQGDMSLTLLPVPALSAQGVRLASIEGGSAAPMVDLKELRVRIALLPLLEGTVQVERILLVEPRISLEVLPDGRRNWSFANGSSAASGSIGPDASALDFRFDDVSIENGTVIYRDAEGGRDERIDELNARIVAESLDGPFAAKGSMRLHGIGAAFEGTLGRLVDDGATPVNVVVKPAEGTARVQFSGAISSHPGTLAVHGRLKGEGENLAAVIVGLSGAGESRPDALARAFEIQGEVSVDPQAATVSELSVVVGGVRFTGEMTSLLAPPFDARLTLAAAQIDLDRMLEAQDSADDAGGPPAPAPSGAEDPRKAWVLPADARGRLELSADAVIYRGQLIRQVRLDAALSDGALQLERAMALLPGSSDISLTGSLRQVDGQAEFDGHLEAASDNLRGLLQWAGVDLSRVPSERLRRMSMSGRLTGSPKQIAISDLDLRADLTRVSGGLVIAPRNRPGFGVGLALDSLNLDAYLPSGETRGGDESDSPEQQAEPGGETAAVGLAPLDRFDANLNLRAGAITLHGVTAKDLQVEATLQDGALEFRRARIGNLGGGEVDYVGRIDQIATRPSLDGSLQVSVSEPGRLAPLFDASPEALAGVPGFTGEGRISGGLDDLALDARLSAAGGRLEMAGTLNPRARPLGFDFALTGRHPDLAALLETAGRPLPPDADLGILDLGLRVAGEPRHFRVSELEGAIGPATLSGGFAVAVEDAGAALSELDVLIDVKHPHAGRLARLAGLGARDLGGLGGLDVHARLSGGPAQARLDELAASVGPLQLSGAVALGLRGLDPRLESYDLSVVAKHPDLAGLAADLGWGGDPAAGLGGLDLAARVQGDKVRMRVEELSGNLGPVDLTGDLSADFGGDRPNFVAELETGDLPLDVLVAGLTRTAAPDASADGGEDLSPAAIDVAALQSFDGRLELRAAALTYGKLRADRAELRTDLRAGRLTLERLAGSLHGGRLQMSGTAELGEGIAAELAVTAIEVELGDLLGSGSEGISGPLFLDGDFTTRGASEVELVSGLEGAAEVSGLLSVEGEAGDDPGDSSRNPEGITELAGSVLRDLGRDSIRLAGTLTAEAGTLHTEDLRLDGQPAYALTLAKLDLAGWTLDGVTDIYERSARQTLITSLAYGGPPDALQIERLDLTTSPAPDLEEQIGTEPPEETAPRTPEEAPSEAAEEAAPEAEGAPAPEAAEEEEREEPAPAASEQPAPLVSETAEPEPALPQGGAEAESAPSQPEPASPEAAPQTEPQPASPPTPQPAPQPDEDDLLKDLLRLGG